MPGAQHFFVEDDSVEPSSFSRENILIYNSVKQFTMTSLEMVNALVEAAKYVVRNKIEGASVECGAWRGGSAMAIALALVMLNIICNSKITLGA